MTAEQPASPDPRTLLADLESRQDELLRLLDELEQRTKQALERHNAAEAAAPQVKPGPVRRAA